MPGPYDYTIQQPDIAGSLLGGFQAGTQIGAMQQARDAADNRAADIQQYLQKPSARGASDLMVKYPDMQKALSESFGTYSQERKDNAFKTGIQAISAVQNGRPEIAMNILDEQIKAAENTGEDTSDLVSLKKSFEQDPDGAGAGLNLAMAALNPEGFDKIMSTQRATAMAPHELGKAKAESRIKQFEAGYAPEREFLESTNTRAGIRNIESQIKERSRRLDLDEDKLMTETELKLNELGQKSTSLDDSAKKIVNDAVVASVAADQTAGQFLDLASQIDQQGGGYGAFTTAGEFIKSATGNQDAMTALRREYIRLRNTQAIKSLPPGAASDADVAMSLQGFPEASADAKTLASFLRGTAKLSQIESVNESAKAEWANAVGYLGKPKKDIEIDGISVPAGSTFTDFAKTYIPAKTGQRGAQQAQQQIPQRSYMKFANPAGGQ